MKKPAVVLGFTALTAVLIVMLITQVLAATYINIQISGTVNYTATEIGARMFAVQNVVSGGGGVLA
ncbi:MAG: hypothetical protein IKC79_01710 [Clostridia bacterium]|nr:hypothetical protein [Clostridia bacterium]